MIDEGDGNWVGQNRMLNSPLEFVTALNAYAVAFVIEIEKQFQDGSNLEPPSIDVGVVLAALIAFIYAGILALGVGIFLALYIALKHGGCSSRPSNREYF